mmetsp:Transcript_17806/g.41780  ORF Transcript_17806/g.41780 Transcript_17806/m.41780 type:complete len:316 (-) Transcript_17806:83-1030(-)
MLLHPLFPVKASSGFTDAKSVFGGPVGQTSLRGRHHLVCRLSLRLCGRRQGILGQVAAGLRGGGRRGLVRRGSHRAFDLRPPEVGGGSDGFGDVQAGSITVARQATIGRLWRRNRPSRRNRRGLRRRLGEAVAVALMVVTPMVSFSKNWLRPRSDVSLRGLQSPRICFGAAFVGDVWRKLAGITSVGMPCCRSDPNTMWAVVQIQGHFEASVLILVVGPLDGRHQILARESSANLLALQDHLPGKKAILAHLRRLPMAEEHCHDFGHALSPVHNRPLRPITPITTRPSAHASLAEAVPSAGTIVPSSHCPGSATA